MKVPRAQPITGKNSLRGSLVLSGSVRDLTHYPSRLNRKRAEREVDFSKETKQTATVQKDRFVSDYLKRNSATNKQTNKISGTGKLL